MEDQESCPANPCLELEDLYALGMTAPGLGGVRAASHIEATTVCLWEERHRPGAPLVARGSENREFLLKWTDAGKPNTAAWDQGEATEEGACAIAILLARQCRNLTVLERSFIGTGFDYWMGRGDCSSSSFPPAGAGGTFQDKTRLEVSGIRRGTDQQIHARVSRKMKQTERSQGAYPALVIVVEFGRLIAYVEDCA